VENSLLSDLSDTPFRGAAVFQQAARWLYEVDVCVN
jgi:hypothetical protein